jgi:hypothetical protein
MIAALERSTQCDLLIQHLHSARVYLLSAMPEEFLVALESAKTALNMSATVVFVVLRAPIWRTCSTICRFIRSFR